MANRKLIMSVFSGCITMALAMAPAAFAQDDDEVIEEIVVTGSHIARSPFSDAIPVTLLDSEDMEIAGVETLDGLLQQLPSVQQVNGARESQSGTDRSGVASVALRGLGVSRTLTLLDGKRMVSSRNVCFGRWSQPLDATQAVNLSAGVSIPLCGVNW